MTQAPSAPDVWSGRRSLPLLAVQETGIVLRWLTRLRWLAVAGQTVATFIAVAILHLSLPWRTIYAIIALTALSNVVLSLWTGRRPWPWLVPAVLLVDLGLLTALLICSGGPTNPFCALYLVHVAMAVVTLSERWSWIVVAAATACYGMLFAWSLPHAQPLIPSRVAAIAADWVALALVAVLIAYFVGRMTHSLREHEKELADARERASRNEQLAALTTLAAGAAHELNTPLSTIAVVARELELQSRKLESGESLAKDAQLIRQEVDRCQFILSRMRDVPSAPSIHGAEASPATTVAQLVEQLGREMQAAANAAGASLRFSCDNETAKLETQANAVRQALVILVDNALDASGSGKTVEVCIYNRNGHIVFEVRDQGAGMSAEVARRAGEPFFTTKPPGHGMGLGLFLARRVAEKLGGSLKLESKQGQGTRAMLELPRTP